MIVIIIFRIYLTGVIAGLIFPFMDEFLLKYSGPYQDICSDHENIAMKIYRRGPVHHKLMLALIPILNLVHILFIGVILYSIIRLVWVSTVWIWWQDKKYRFVMWLAMKPIKKGFIFRTKLVKILFPSKLNFYYKCIELCNSSELTDRLIISAIKILKESMDNSDSINIESDDQ